MKVDKPGPRKKPLPPLPSSFYDLYTSKPASQLDASCETDKNGKVRALPHIEGQWPTHVYLEWKPDVAWRRLEMLNGAIAKVLETYQVVYHSLAKSDVGVRLPLHVSLSDTLMPTTESKQQVTDSICEAVTGWKGPIKINVSKTKLQVVLNRQKTRAFVVLALTDNEPIVRLIAAVNAAVEPHGLPALAAHPHVSIGWFLPRADPDPVSDAIVTSPETDRHLTALFGKVTFDCVKIKCGRLVQSVRCI
ncbi:U6 snRNA phosphodiesterase Usb1 [Yarrowia lipolytica]|jgi:hypothetical protein|uniref:U6 snRNA phosphodiesterase n=1 Tax=Yarrowia lipolytica TaxID=4952 RepID=A0A1D8NIV1_YARLL|nr:hypothetical protein YALI1_E20215g [Yarrowia lipolytica]KAB8282714.1 U6 snRNA phosphodiesterase Usb1 [Yarrowia lipolytica]KAE8173798.1 U6 snRNA phosphodiesterase Usb1 [Yarrowia lipolytica]KAJ8057021.1 U6 snRNA phosphodiesterase Usb1 [Yarrowia lipolytica]QNP99023.1 U6 snRNA phosphodiesterase [Yarrowia lipolytica]